MTPPFADFQLTPVPLAPVQTLIPRLQTESLQVWSQLFNWSQTLWASLYQNVGPNLTPDIVVSGLSTGASSAFQLLSLTSQYLVATAPLFNAPANLVALAQLIAAPPAGLIVVTNPDGSATLSGKLAQSANQLGVI